MQDSTYNNREFTLSTSWEYYTWNHTTTEASPELRIQYRSAGTVWLDEISVEAHSIPGTGIYAYHMFKKSECTMPMSSAAAATCGEPCEKPHGKKRLSRKTNVKYRHVPATEG